MKKIILLLLLVLVSITASARKSYITVWVDNINGSAYQNYIRLSGDVPNNIEGFEYDSAYHYWKNNTSIRTYSTGEILNLLSEYGYEVEFVNSIVGSSSNGTGSPSISYLLSKEISSGQTISKGDVNEDSEVNIADVNEVISLILGIVREHPEILEQIKKQTNH